MNIWYVSMGSNGANESAFEAAKSKYVDEFLFQCGSPLSTGFREKVGYAMQFHFMTGLPVIIGQQLWTPWDRDPLLLTDENAIMFRLAVCGRPVYGRVKTAIDVEPQTDDLSKIKGETIPFEKYVSIKQTLPPIFDYVLPESCGKPRSMFRLFNSLGKREISEQTYRRSQLPLYPVSEMAVIGLALSYKPANGEYTADEAIVAYPERDKFFYPTNDRVIIARRLAELGRRAL